MEKNRLEKMRIEALKGSKKGKGYIGTILSCVYDFVLSPDWIKGRNGRHY